MKTAICDKCPAKIDVGPVYTVDPQRRAAYAAGNGFSPVERELVFDIDLTDYDDVRTCGKEGHICTKCWPLMAVAIAILDRGLREDFGFKHIFFVFSGRRGVHAWVCDERARKLTDEQRASIAQYFAIYKGNEKGIAKLSTGLEDHPSVAKAYDILLKAFEGSILQRQGLLEDPVHIESILSYLPSDAVCSEIKRRWAEKINHNDDDQDTSLRRWHILSACVKEEQAALMKLNPREGKKARALGKGLKDIVFAYAYPRLDMEVSKKLNHLLKAPFCVHPKTGKVCVPINPASAWEFNPCTVCTVGQLLNQLNQAKNTGDKEDAWKYTDMAAAVDTFHSCFLDAMQSEIKESLTAKARDASDSPTLAW